VFLSSRAFQHKHEEQEEHEDGWKRRRKKEEDGFDDETRLSVKPLKRGAQ
jgi:hypothetical protein